MTKVDFSQYQLLKQMIEDAVNDSLFDNGFEPDGTTGEPDFIAVYTKNDLSDVKVVINGVHYEGEEDFNPDDYILDYAYSIDEAYCVADKFFDVRK